MNEFHTLFSGINFGTIRPMGNWMVMFDDEKDTLYVVSLVVRSERDGKKYVTEFRNYFAEKDTAPDPMKREGFRMHQAGLDLKNAVAVEREDT